MITHRPDPSFAVDVADPQADSSQPFLSPKPPFSSIPTLYISEFFAELLETAIFSNIFVQNSDLLLSCRFGSFCSETYLKVAVSISYLPRYENKFIDHLMALFWGSNPLILQKNRIDLPLKLLAWHIS
ncbi:hypothetical protein Hanom_Chr03g00274861 [Helianthus anomalus]